MQTKHCNVIFSFIEKQRSGIVLYVWFLHHRLLQEKIIRQQQDVVFFFLELIRGVRAGVELVSCFLLLIYSVNLLQVGLFCLSHTDY